MRLRRALLVTTAFSTVLMGGVGAANAQAFDWSGFYVGFGVAAGGSFTPGTLDWDDPDDEIWSTDVLGSATTSDAEPFIGLEDASMEFPGAGGGFGAFGSIGFNTQMDNFLFGVEASITTGPFRTEETFVQTGTVTVTNNTATLTLSSATYGTTYLSTIQTTYDTSTSVSYETYSNVTTITGAVTDTIVTYTDTITTYITESAVNSLTTYVFPTTSSSTTTVTHTTDTTYNTITTQTLSNLTSFSTGESVISFSTNGEWNETITGRAQIDWLATIKGRIGITADRTLFFATGGLAIAGVSQETTATLTVDGPNGSQTITEWTGTNNETRFGFVVGGGIEHALDDHWIISGEAEYFNLGTAEYGVTSDDPDIDSNAGRQTQVLDGGSVKLGIKYKF